jgi:CRP-like cAMP-binding protein
MDQSFVIHAPSFDASVEHLSENLLSGDEQDRLRNLATLLQYRRGQTVYSQGEETRYIHFIGSGIVRVFRSGERGKRQIIIFRTVGDLCGLPAETVSAARIYRVPWQVFHPLMLATPHLQGVLLRKVTADYHQAQSRIMMMGQENIFHRVATFLIDMMAITQFFDSERSLLHLPMNRFDVADYLGTRPETAARAFSKLEQMGIIRRITPRRIKIVDTSRLALMQQGPRRGNRDTSRLTLMQQEPRRSNREIGIPPASLELGFKTLTAENISDGGAYLGPS